MKKKYLIIGVVVIVLGLAAYLLFKNDQATAPAPSTNNSKPVDNTGTTPAATSPAAFDKTKYSLTDPNSPWVVVNKTRPLQPKTYAPTDLTSVGNGQQMHREAAEALQQLFAGAKQAGLTVTAASAYRSYNYQIQVYNSEVQTYGQAVADSESARPGTSEHQTGWAVDVAGGGCSVEDCFGDTAEGKWVAAHASEYGFILRYPQGKEAVTGYRYEAWHIRYVGTDLAQEMKRQNSLTLEEFFGLPAAPNYL